MKTTSLQISRSESTAFQNLYQQDHRVLDISIFASQHATKTSCSAIVSPSLGCVSSACGVEEIWFAAVALTPKIELSPNNFLKGPK